MADAQRPGRCHCSWRAEGVDAFPIGIGLSTGDVAAALLGSDERLEYTIVGDAVNLCQRLQQLGGDGQIVFGEATWQRLTQPPDDAEDLGEQLVKRQVVAHSSAADQHPWVGDDPTRRRRAVRERFTMTMPSTNTSSPTGAAERILPTDQADEVTVTQAGDVNAGPRAAGSPVVSARGIYRTFEQETAPIRALRGADLTIERGEFVAVMGPSGCGKSTLLNVIAGLDQPDEGEIEVAGLQLVGLNQSELAIMRRRHIGVVFQFFNLLDGMTVIENVAMPALIAGMKRRAAETRARDLLDLLGISDKAQQAPASLSGGQRQRLAIARALANQPTLLLADEPTGALDAEGGNEVLELFSRLHAAQQTILLVTHDQPVADAAQRIVRMRDGRVVDDGRPAHQ